MIIYILIIILGLFGPICLTECNIKYEYERLCNCKTRYSYFGLIGNEIFPPGTNYTYCDNDDLKYHKCYKENCVDECEKSIRLLNEVQSDKISQSAGNNLCFWLENKSITEEGLVLLSEAHPGVCPVEYRQILHRICCNMRCKCSIQLNGLDFIDLSDRIPKKESFYDCNRSEFGECETDCRLEASKYLKNNPILLNKKENSLNLFTDKAIGDQFCEIADRKIDYPGSISTLSISTMPGEQSLSKHLNLGSLCCEQECKCEFIDALGNLVHSLNLSSKTNKYFDCSKKFIDCKKECLKEADQFFGTSSSSFDNQMEIFNFFENNLPETDGPNFLCQKLNKSSYRPGTNIFLRIRAGFEEKINYGKLCCKRPCKCQLIGKHAGVFMSEFVELEHNSKLIQDLSAFMPARNLSYDCSKESQNCMNDCKLAAGFFLNTTKLKDPKEPIQSLDIFFEFKAATKVCKTLNKQLNSPGVEVFLRYDTQSSTFQSFEDLFIGRICCNEFLFPSNKCKYPILPDIENN